MMMKTANLFQCNAAHQVILQQDSGVSLVDISIWWMLWLTGRV